MRSDIGWAVEELLGGGNVRRRGWNGKNQYLEYVPFWRITPDSKPGAHFVAIHAQDGTLVPWLCSQADLLATDWERC
jgi:hypothetical protein